MRRNFEEIYLLKSLNYLLSSCHGFERRTCGHWLLITGEIIRTIITNRKDMKWVAHNLKQVYD